MALENEFHSGQTIFQEIDSTNLPTNSVQFQDMVCEALIKFENGSQLVEKESIFSKNEELDDIGTEFIKYITIPYYIGELHLKVVDSDRVDQLTTAVRYFNQFLATCKKLKLVRKEDLKSLYRDAPTDPTSRRAELITRVKREKANKARLEAIVQQKAAKKSSNDNDDELERRHILLLVDGYVQKSISQLELTEVELNMLSMVSQNPPQESRGNRNSTNNHFNNPEIYTILPGGRRVELAQQVFRPGFNMATITPEEAVAAEISNGRMVKGPGGAASAKKGDSENEDEDVDNEEKLCSTRNWDDFKDDNPRGWGNTKQ